MNQPFDRIIFVMFENQYRNYVLKDTFMEKLARAGANLTNFFGAFHPSQTNYLASLTGEVCGVTNDTPPEKPLQQATLVDLLESSQLDWKAYMEGYPNEQWNPIWKESNYPQSAQPINQFPNDGTSLARYFRKHNAFASMHSIQSNKERWAKIVDDHQFWKDVANDDLPHYSWFTPDIWNDGHYLYNTHVDTNPRTQLIPQLAGWLEYVFFADINASSVQGAKATGLEKIGLNLDIDLVLTDPKRAYNESNIPAGTLIVITFDEADFDAVGFDTSYDGPNQVYTVLLGDMIKPGTSIDVPYNHYSLIKTVEKNYNLGSLYKNDLDANWLRFMWGESFSWSTAMSMDLQQVSELASTNFKSHYHLLVKQKDDTIWESLLKDNEWSEPVSTGIHSSNRITVSTIDDLLLLVFTDKNNNLLCCTSKGDNKWSEPIDLKIKAPGCITSSSYYDLADKKSKVMLCWATENGFIKYLIYQDGKWSRQSEEVGQLTDGPMALSQLGGSLYLVYKERNTRGMRLTSFNLAPYNAFDALTFDDHPSPVNNTSIHQWSPADMAVGNFAKKMSAEKNEYLTIGNLALASIEGEMHLVHRGAYEDTPNAMTSYFGLTGIFTAEHALTNGYGTIEQAGWTKEKELTDVQLTPTGPLAMASKGEGLILIWLDATANTVNWKRGGYGN